MKNKLLFSALLLSFGLCTTTNAQSVNFPCPTNIFKVEGGANNVLINNGDLSPDLSDGSQYDFTAQGTTKSSTFTMTNLTAQTIDISSVSLSGANSNQFSISTSPSSTISANGTTTFVIDYSPTVDGSHQALVTIENDICTGVYECNYTFLIEGTTSCNYVPFGVAFSSDFNTNIGACSPNGSITITPIDGVAPYTYSWADDVSNTTNIMSNLPNINGKRYYCTITDANNTEVVVSPILALTKFPEYSSGTHSSSLNPTTTSSTDGIASVNPNFGTPPYTYAWSNGASTPSIQNLGVGQYTVTITAGNSCVIADTITLSAETLSTAYATPTIGSARNPQSNSGANTFIQFTPNTNSTNEHRALISTVNPVSGKVSLENYMHYFTSSDNRLYLMEVPNMTFSASYTFQLSSKESNGDWSEFSPVGSFSTIAPPLNVSDGFRSNTCGNLIADPYIKKMFYTSANYRRSEKYEITICNKTTDPSCSNPLIFEQNAPINGNDYFESSILPDADYGSNYELSVRVKYDGVWYSTSSSSAPSPCSMQLAQLTDISMEVSRIYSDGLYQGAQISCGSTTQKVDPTTAAFLITTRNDACNYTVEIEGEFADNPGLTQTKFVAIGDKNYFYASDIPGLLCGNRDYFIKVQAFIDGNLTKGSSKICKITTVPCPILAPPALNEKAKDATQQHNVQAGEKNSSFTTEQQYDFEIYPNPSKDEQISLNYYSEKSKNTVQNIEITILDISGKLITSKQLKLNNGYLSYQLNRSEMPSSGIYVVNLRDQDQVISRKIVINK